MLCDWSLAGVRLAARATAGASALRASASISPIASCAAAKATVELAVMRMSLASKSPFVGDTNGSEPAPAPCEPSW